MGWWRVVLGDGTQNRRERSSRKWPPARRCVVKHRAQPEQIGPRIHRQSVGLLRREITRAAKHRTRSRQLVHAVPGAGQPKVENHHAIAGGFDEQIRGLHVPMDKPRFMRGSQPQRCLAAYPRHLGSSQNAAPIEPIRERLAFEQRHDEEG